MDMSSHALSLTLLPFDNWTVLMKNVIRIVFAGIYKWQMEQWGESNLPALTSLLLLSMFQFFNIFSILLIVQAITKIELFKYLSTHMIVGLIPPILILIGDYLIVKPINRTVNEQFSKAGLKAFLYISCSIAFLILCGICAWKIV